MSTFSFLMRNCLRCITVATAEMDRLEFCRRPAPDRAAPAARAHTHTRTRATGSKSAKPTPLGEGEDSGVNLVGGGNVHGRLGLT